MRKLFGESKTKSVKILMAVIAGIFLISLLGSIYVLRPSGSRRAEVVQDGRVLYTFELDRAENQELTIYYGDSSNTILIQDGEICVSAAECPDQTCVKMGKLYSDSLPIVCLPNHLIIRFAE